MKMVINGERLIKDLQDDFNFAYAFLTIEFFRNGSVRRDRYPAQQKISPQHKLETAWIWKKDKGCLDLHDYMTVLELENVLMDEFGLSTQVFRKSGNIWLETTKTDNWTLKQQNDHGKEISYGWKITEEDESRS